MAFRFEVPTAVTKRVSFPPRAVLLGTVALFLLQGCTASLNNPQGILEASPLLAEREPEPSATPDIANEESFMPADHVRIRPSTDRTRINQSLTFTAEAGTPPYLFIQEDGGGSLNSLTGAFTAPGTPGFAIVAARDEQGTSDRATVLFKDPPALTPTPTVIAVGNTLRIGAAGGTRPYSYSVTLGNDKATYDPQAGILSAIAPGVTQLTLTDLDGETATLDITIVPVLQLTAPLATLGLGSTQALTTTGGVSPITYRVAAGGGILTSPTDSGVTYTAPAATGASVVEAKDALGNTSIALLEITPPLLLSPGRSIVPFGESQELTATGGSPPYSFELTTGDGTLASSPYTATFTAPSTSGTSRITVTDSRGLTATADIISHATLGFELSSADVTVGQNVQLTATGGLGTLSYSVQSGGGSVSPSGLYSAPASPGTALIRVTDTAANRAEISVRVLAELSLSPATLDVMAGTSASFGTLGGLSPYTYSIVPGGGGTADINSGTGAFTAGSQPGALQVRVTDSRGNTATADVTVVSTLSIIPGALTVAPGSVTAISTTGGLTPVILTLSAGPGTLTGSNFTAPAGNGTTILKAVDALGNQAFATLTTLIPLSIIPTNVDIPGSGSLTFSADGGNPPYTYSLGTGSLGNIAPSTGLFLAPPGSGSAQVVVTDATGATATATVGVLPDIRITSPASGTVAPTGVTLAGTCEIGLDIAIGGTGTPGTQTVSCTDGTFSLFVPFSSGDGTKTLTASQTSGILTGSAERDFERLSPLPSATSILLAAGASHTRLTAVDVTLGAVDAAEVYLTEVAGCATGGTWQSYGTNKNFSFGTRNGTVTIYAKFRNAELNEGSCISDSIVHDDIAPVLTVSSPSSGALTQGSISASGTCEAGLNIAVSGSGVSSPSTLACGDGGTFSDTFGLATGDGAKTVTYTLTDAAGNATTITHTYTRDTTAPATPTISPADGTAVGATVTLSGSCDDGTTLVIAGTGISGGPHSPSCTAGTYSQSISLTASGGSKAFSVTSTDAAGNSSSSSSTVVRDVTGPALTLTSHSEGAAVQGSPTLVGACETGASVVTISGSGLASSPQTATCSAGSWTSTLTLASGDGTKALSLSQSDSFSNTTSLSLNLTKDTVSPSLSFSPDPDGTQTQASIGLSGSCESGISIVISGTGASAPTSLNCSGNSFSGTLTLATGDGSKTVTYSQTDTAGNATTITHTYTRDTTAPATPTISPADGTTVGATVTLSGSCDTGTTLLIAGTGISGGPHSPSCTAGAYSQSISITAGGGSKAFSVTSTDGAGNSSSLSSTVVRDVTGPALTQTALAEGAQVSSTAGLSGECEDGGSSVSITGSGLLSSPETASCNVGVWSKTVTLSAGEGSKALSMQQSDSFGNATTLTLSLDSDRSAPTSPSISIGGPDPTNSISAELTLGASETPAQMYITQSADCTSGGVWEAFSASKTWTLSSANASNTVRAKFRDAAGNETGCASDSVTHDSIAPSVAITSPAAGTIDPSGVTVSGTCDTGISVVLSGGLTSNVTTPCNSGTFSAAVAFSAGAGSKSIVASQTDGAGNSGSDARSFTKSASSRIYASASLAPADNLAEVLIFAVPTNASGNYINGASVEISATPTTNITVSSGHASSACASASAYCKKGLEVGDGIYMVRAKVAVAGTGTSYAFSATVTGAPSGSVTGSATVLFKTADFTPLSTNTTIDNTATYLNKNLYLTGGTITFGANSVGQTYGHIFVRGSTIAVPASTTSATTPLDITVSSFNFQSGTFNVNDRGYPAGYSYGATGPSTSLVPNSVSVGASHGGMGGKTGSTSAAPVYGNYRNPVHPGSGAGTGGTGIGGGAIRIQSTEGCALSASISAMKGTGGNTGSGGSINLRCGSIYLAAGQTLKVNGSDGGTTMAGAAGGRIALVTTSDAKSLSGALAYPDTPARLDTFTTAVQARGGSGSFGNSQGSGAAGTIYIKHANLTHGDLLIDNGCSYQVGDLSGKTRLPSLAGTISSISGNAITITPSADSILNANTTNLYQGLRVRGDINIDNATPSDWSDDSLLEVASNSTTTLNMTSAPAAGVAVSDTLRSIDVLDHLEISGCALLETAGDLYIRSGSISNPDQPQLAMTNGRLFLLGSAASSLQSSNAFSTGTWTFSSAQSWSALTISGGTLNTQGLTTTTGGLTITGGTLTNTGTITSAGTYTQSGGIVSTDNFAASQNVNLSGGTLSAKLMTATGNLALSGTATLTHPASTSTAAQALDATVGGSISLSDTSKIFADGKGYPNGYGFGATPQTTTAPHAWNGGSHGGTGGLDDSYPGAGGSNKVPLVHGDYRNPRSPGCGTGSTNSGYASGGGVISLTAIGTCTVNSGTTISANAESGQSMVMAAGGSIRLQCGAFAGTAGASAISAKGGGNGTASAGGGGRIALISTGNTSTFGGNFPWPADSSTLATLTTSVNANGGLGADSKTGDGHGGAGSVFLQHSYNPASPPVTGGALIFDNGRSGNFQVSLRSGVSSLRSLAGTITNISADRTTLTVRIDTGTSNYNLITSAFANVFSGLRIRPDITNDANANNSITDDETVTVTANTNLTVTGGVTTTTLTVSPAVSGAVAINDQFRSIDIVDRFYVGGGGIFQTAGDLVISDRIIDAPDGSTWSLSAAISQLLGSASVNITPSYAITTGSYHLGSYQLTGDLNATNLNWSSSGILSAPNLAITAGGSLTQTTGTIDITNILSSTGNMSISGTLSAPTITATGNYSQTAGTVTTQTMAITGNLSLSGSAKITHTANGDTAPIQLITATVGGNFSMSGTSQIDAKGKGHIAGDAYGFATQLQSVNGGGASHGGVGGWDDADAISTQIGPSYDDYRNPELPGAGDSTTGSYTTAGGGVVRIQANGSCIFNDSANIDAESGGYSTGYRSAGGSIKLTCASFGGTATGLTLKAGAGSSPSGEPGGGGGRIALISTGNASSFSGALPWPGNASGDSTTLATLLGRVRVTGATADGNNGDGGAGTLFLKHSGLTHGALIINNGTTSPSLVQRSGTTRLVSLTGTISAISADRLTITIGSTSPYTLTAYYADIFRGMRIRPSLSYDAGTPNDWTDDEIRTVVSNTQTTLTLDAPVHSSVTAGATFRSIDVLDHLEISGGSVLESHGDIYITNGPLLNAGATSWNLTEGVLSLGGSAGINLLPTLQLAGGTWYVRPQSAIGAMTHSSAATVTFDNLAISSGGFTQSAGSVTLTGTASIAGGINLSGGTLTAETLNISSGDITMSGSATLTHPVSSGNGTSIKRLSMTLPAGGLTLSGTSRINADAKGWNGNTFFSSDDIFDAATATAASHGGSGGKQAAGNTLAATYGDFQEPAYPGAGRKTATNEYGGGVVTITAANTCTINSGTSITANGNAAGSAGGSLHLQCGGFSGSAGSSALTANGGSATASTMGGGGGGRIALISTGDATSFSGSFSYPSGSAALAAFKGVVKAIGGSGHSTPTGDGGAGTIYIKHSGLSRGDLIIDNGKSSTNATLGGSTPFIAATDNTNKLYSRVDTNTVNVTNGGVPYTNRLNYYEGRWIHIDPVTGYTADPLDGAGHTFIRLTGNGANTFITDTGAFPAISASNYYYRFVTRLNHLDIAGYSQVSFANSDLVLDSGCDLHSSSSSAFDVPTGSAISAGNTFSSQTCRSAERTGTTTFTTTALAP